MWVWSLGLKDSPEQGVATRSSILAWKIPWTEELGRLPSMGSQRVRHGWSDWEHVRGCTEPRLRWRVPHRKHNLSAGQDQAFLFSGSLCSSTALAHGQEKHTRQGKICHGLEAPDLMAAKYFLKQLNLFPRSPKGNPVTRVTTLRDGIWSSFTVSSNPEAIYQPRVIFISKQYSLVL